MIVLLMSFETEEETNKFMRIYDRYKRYIWYTISLYVNNRSDAEDIFQEVLIIIGNNLDHIDESHFTKSRNYIITIATNYSKNFIRRKTKEKLELWEDVEIGSFKSPVDIVIEKEEYELLKEKISGLKDTYKEVMELKYFNHFTDENIARYLHLSKSNVRMRLLRGKRILAESLQMEEADRDEI